MVDRLTGLEWGQLIFTVTIGPNKAMLSFLKTWTLYLLGATRVPFSRVLSILSSSTSSIVSVVDQNVGLVSNIHSWMI